MPPLILFLKNALQKELPHEKVEGEDLQPFLKKSLIEANQAIRAGTMQPPPRPCAVLLAFYKFENEWYLPFIVRPKKSRTHPGQIAFPGGKQEEEDKDLIETAIRETEEEIGVSTNRKNVIGSLSGIYIPPSNAWVVPIVAFLDDVPTFSPNPDEVSEVLQIRLNDLKNLENKTIKDVPLPENQLLKMPAYQIGDYEIWGGTARMIDELNKILL